MNQQQKEIQQTFLDNEKAVLKQIEANYEDAIAEINSKLAELLGRDDADLQNVIYQINYQNALKEQIQGILNQLHANEFQTVSEYLANAYEDGFIGAMYDMQAQGVPLVIPINQEQVVAAILHETKLSDDLYEALGKDTKRLSKQIAQEISRGISNNATYGEMARNIASFSNIPKNNAARIARTEAHRIQCKATADAQWKAKAKGADVVKQWDSTLDGKTRSTHRQLDGQIRELDEPFEADGYEVMQPGDFGDPSQDCNCRCALLQRARWALGNDFTKWSTNAPVVVSDKSVTQLVKIKAKDYNDFKKQFFEAVDKKIIEGTVASNGVVVNYIAMHQYERMEERKITIQDVKSALVSPLKIGEVIYDELGRPSQRFIGKKATVNVNPDNQTIVTTWKTGQATIRKIEREMQNHD